MPQDREESGGDRRDSSEIVKRVSSRPRLDTLPEIREVVDDAKKSGASVTERSEQLLRYVQRRFTPGGHPITVPQK